MTSGESTLFDKGIPPSLSVGVSKGKVAAPEEFQLDYEGLLEEALAQPIGLGVICKGDDGADRLRRILYKTKRALRDAGKTRYDDLVLSISPGSDIILFIYEKAVQNGEGT